MPLRRRARGAAFSLDQIGVPAYRYPMATLRRPENLFSGLSAANHRLEAADSGSSAAFSTTRRRHHPCLGASFMREDEFAMR